MTRTCRAFRVIRNLRSSLASRLLLWRAGVAGFAFMAGILARGAGVPTTAIKVDQVGYPVNGSKIALVSAPAKTFDIRHFGDGKVAFYGLLEPARLDPAAADAVEVADFSGLRREGRFFLEVPGVGKSWTFAVGKNIYEQTYLLAMRGFYGQRCRMRSRSTGRHRWFSCWRGNCVRNRAEPHSGSQKSAEERQRLSRAVRN